jgi:phosphodiesterase/alkaline phosphatase D-like protein
VGADRLGGRLALVCALAAALTALTAAPASAAFSHPAVSGSFGSDGTSATTIGGLDQLAFNQASQRLYALGRSPAKVYGFDTTTPGTYTALSGGFPITVSEPGGVPDLATDNSPSSTGNIYFLSESTGLYAFTSAGAGISGFPVGGFGDPCGVATDGEGNVWVGDYGSQSVKKYSSAGASLGSVDVAATGRPCHVEVDRSNDDIYVADYNGGVYRYAKSGGGYASGTLVDPETARAIAVDASSHTLYVAHSSEVDAYNESGAHLETFATGLGGLSGVAVDEARGIVYVSAANKVQVLPGVVVPDVVTGDQTGDATVNGHVDPAGGGEITSCEFEFGTDTSYGESAPCSQSTPISAPADVSADLSGEVVGETTYHYRLVASNANGTSYGGDRTFTPHFVSGLSTDPATGVGKNTATLNAHFIGTEEDTHYYFEWGTTTEYGDTSAAPPGDDAGSTSGGTPLSFDASGLLTGTTYHYRVVATNSKGTSTGNDQTFTTVDAVAFLTTEPATDLTGTSATLNGTWTGEGVDTTCHFEWGYNTLYGNTTPDVGEGSGSGPQSASVQLTGLSPVTTFHYRIVCSNSFGTTEANDRSLKTLALPAVAVQPPSDYLTDGVTLHGTVGPREGGNTTYHYEYGTTEAYGESTPESASVGSDNGTYPADSELTALQPGTLYHYRLVATSPAGVTRSKDQTFTTVPLLPSVDSTSASGVTPTGATLTATVNPGNGATLVIFDYGPGLSYGSRTLPTEPTPADGADHPLSAQLTGLTPGTTYHYRAVAINFNGVTNGADGTFSTPDTPIVGGGSATGVTQTGALLSGNVQPGFSPTSYHFEYGPTSDYGQSTPAGGLGADNGVHPVSASLAGLAAGTTYHYRLVASNAIGTTSGADHTFATSPAPPVTSAPPRSPACRKGFVRRHGRCVRRRHRHRHRAKHRKRHHRHGGRNA